MGLGIVGHLKDIAPLLLYVAGVLLFFGALAGRGRWTLALVAFLIPLRNVVEKIQVYPGGTKFITYLILAMVIGWLLLAGSRRIQFMAPSALNIISLLTIMYMFISLEWGSHYRGFPMFDVHDPRVQDWKNYCMMPILFFLTLNTITDKKWVWRIFWVMCAAMALMVYYTSSQVMWFSSLESRAKITGTFQFLGPNETAAFFNQYSIILLSVYFSMKMGLKKNLLLLLILGNLYCMVFMYSRAAYLGIAVGLFFLLAFKNKKLLIPLFLVVIFWQVALPEKARQRIEGTTGEYGQLEASAERRINVWNGAIELFQDTPILGIGYGVFRHMGFDLGDTHNIYLKILVEQGLIGIVIFGILLLCFMKEGFALYQKGDDDMSRGLGLGLTICILVLMINNIFGDRWSYLELSGHLWIYAGLVGRLRVIAEKERADKKNPVKNEISKPRKRM